MYRVAAVASHPIQYQAPLFRALAEHVDLTVFFCHRQTPEEQASAGFDIAFDWDVPLLDGYRSERLTNISAKPTVDRFSGCDSPDVRDRLSRGRFDACLVSGWYLKAYLQAIRACKALGVPVVVRGDSNLATNRSLLTRAAKYIPYRVLLNQIDAHLFVGQANRDYLCHYGVPESRLFFSPHFVENHRFAAVDAGAATELRQSWGAAPEDTVFLFAGKLIAIKRVEDFIAAVGLAARRQPKIRGVIVGSGPLENELRGVATREAAPVAFAGFMNQTGMPAAYAAADCLVLPSSGESWGLVVNEAMAAGRPAIVSDRVGCARDLIVDGTTGFTYATGDVTALSGRLLTMAEALTNGRDQVRAAVAAQIAKYSCAAAVAGVREALREVCARSVAAVETGVRHA